MIIYICRVDTEMRQDGGCDSVASLPGTEEVAGKLAECVVGGVNKIKKII